ncbi:hypothetical protein PPL_07682 [Heterostelium album PN500]|uniref:Uncharacterized protein n=1 Tax=Heterostelium pallidum (strain ATCC 26659 / Pp 5 / PN500) TaxID=670386 RepID=D3BGN0_HETP5|nr:hypothetical protein PPL_07682 [Heterostelium album PN500]EFA79264.1 hypothetical protein PPL_07682 [Heterostelium album PN500]|eukprot:XP_020431385.1 hypothetical protein PPL_07682 [Heterostelium album PN500]
MDVLFPKYLFLGNQYELDALTGQLSKETYLKLTHVDHKHPNKPIPINIFGTYLCVIISLDLVAHLPAIDPENQLKSNQSRTLVINFGGIKPVENPLKQSKPLKIPGSNQQVPQQTSTQAESDYVNNNNNNNQQQLEVSQHSFKRDLEEWLSKFSSPSTNAECEESELMIKIIENLDKVYSSSYFARNVIAKLTKMNVSNHCALAASAIDFFTCLVKCDPAICHKDLFCDIEIDEHDKIARTKERRSVIKKHPGFSTNKSTEHCLEAKIADIDKTEERFNLKSTDDFLKKKTNKDKSAITQLWDCIRHLNAFGVAINQDTYKTSQNIAFELSSPMIDVSILASDLAVHLKQMFLGEHNLEIPFSFTKHVLAKTTGISVRCFSDVNKTLKSQIKSFYFYRSRHQYIKAKLLLSKRYHREFVHIDFKHQNQCLPPNIFHNFLCVVISKDCANSLTENDCNQFVSYPDKTLIIKFGDSICSQTVVRRQFDLCEEIDLSEIYTTSVYAQKVLDYLIADNGSGDHSQTVYTAVDLFTDLVKCNATIGYKFLLLGHSITEQDIQVLVDEFGDEVDIPSSYSSYSSSSKIMRFAQDIVVASHSDADTMKGCIIRMHETSQLSGKKLHFQEITKLIGNQSRKITVNSITPALPLNQSTPPPPTNSSQEMITYIDSIENRFDLKSTPSFRERKIKGDRAAITQLWDCIHQFNSSGLPFDQDSYERLQRIAIGLSSTPINVDDLASDLAIFLKQLYLGRFYPDIKIFDFTEHVLAKISRTPVRCLRHFGGDMWTRSNIFNFYLVCQLLKSNQSFIILNDKFDLVKFASEILEIQQQKREFHRLLDVNYSVLDSIKYDLDTLEEDYAEWIQSTLFSEKHRDGIPVTRLSSDSHTRWDFFAKQMCLPIGQQIVMSGYIRSKAVLICRQSQYNAYIERCAGLRDKVVHLSLDLNCKDDVIPPGIFNIYHKVIIPINFVAELRRIDSNQLSSHPDRTVVVTLREPNATKRAGGFRCIPIPLPVVAIDTGAENGSVQPPDAQGCHQISEIEEWIGDIHSTNSTAESSQIGIDSDFNNNFSEKFDILYTSCQFFREVISKLVENDRFLNFDDAYYTAREFFYKLLNTDSSIPFKSFFTDINLSAGHVHSLMEHLVVQHNPPSKILDFVADIKKANDISHFLSSTKPFLRTLIQLSRLSRKKGSARLKHIAKFIDHPVHRTILENISPSSTNSSVNVVPTRQQTVTKDTLVKKIQKVKDIYKDYNPYSTKIGVADTVQAKNQENQEEPENQVRLTWLLIKCLDQPSLDLTPEIVASCPEFIEICSRVARNFSKKEINLATQSKLRKDLIASMARPGQDDGVIAMNKPMKKEKLASATEIGAHLLNNTIWSATDSINFTAIHLLASQNQSSIIQNDPRGIAKLWVEAQSGQQRSDAIKQIMEVLAEPSMEKVENQVATLQHLFADWSSWPIYTMIRSKVSNAPSHSVLAGNWETFMDLLVELLTMPTHKEFQYLGVGESEHIDSIANSKSPTHFKRKIFLKLDSNNQSHVELFNRYVERYRDIVWIGVCDESNSWNIGGFTKLTLI